MKIGVLALQGAFIEHQHMLDRLNVETIDVRLPEQLDAISSLIIPGGESTTIGKLAEAYNFMVPLQQFAQKKPIWGTCAGMIFIAKHLDNHHQPTLGVMDIMVQRNAFGRQVDSFITSLDIPELTTYSPEPFPCVFIRAPAVLDFGPSVQILSRLPDDSIVAVKEKHFLATAFHPELTDDLRFHRFFLDMTINHHKNF
ncbi:MAG: pyridoxal 5'-phosphate synthase glutaminase subunit PdxT [Candidatus Magnetomorum sp.]|nr:pyridoxal 5'-phosphate synthase glutaminase subunit PdxT [Candidatus Magnetomorum sp.]